MKKNLFVSILVYLALALCAVTIIPFKAESIGNVEAIIKFVVFPLVIVAISLSCLLIKKKIGNDKVHIFVFIFQLFKIFLCIVT